MIHMKLPSSVYAGPFQGGAHLCSIICYLYFICLYVWVVLLFCVLLVLCTCLLFAFAQTSFHSFSPLSLNIRPVCCRLAFCTIPFVPLAPLVFFEVHGVPNFLFPRRCSRTFIILFWFSCTRGIDFSPAFLLKVCIFHVYASRVLLNNFLSYFTALSLPVFVGGAPVLFPF